MEVTTRRPAIGPGGMCVFVYINGTFYWGLNIIHAELARYLQQKGLDPNNAVYGSVWNKSYDEVPHWVGALHSDTEPISEGVLQGEDGEIYRKLEALFPDIQFDQSQNDMTLYSSWKISREYDEDDEINEHNLTPYDWEEQESYTPGPKSKEPRDSWIAPADAKYGMGLVRHKSYGVIWHKDEAVQEATFKGIYTIHGDPLYAIFEVHDEFVTPMIVPYKQFVELMENRMIFPYGKSDTLNYLPWSEEEQQYYRESAEFKNQVHGDDSDYWLDEDAWFTSWIYPLKTKQLIIRNQMHVNHGQLMVGVKNSDFDEGVIAGVILTTYDRATKAIAATVLINYSDSMDASYAGHGSEQEAGETVIEWLRNYQPDWEIMGIRDTHISKVLWTYDKAVKWTKASIYDIVKKMSTSTEILQAQIDSDPAASTAYQALSAAGGTVYVVGGAVRDAVLGNVPKDLDLMCGGLNDEQIEAALSPYGRLDYTGKDFGVYRFKRNGSEVEIALPRTETSTGPGHGDFSVTADPSLDPSADLARRDFTGNAMAYNPSTGELLDPHGGQQDLQNGDLRLVNPDAFKDDPLRIVRALVAVARFGLEPDEQLLQAIRDEAHSIRNLPGERIQMELDKLLAGNDPARAMQVAADTGLLDYMTPELTDSVGFDQQNPHHDLDVFSHTMQVLKKMSALTNDPDLRLAALFHDSGKPTSFWLDPDRTDGGGHFYKKVFQDGTTIGEDHEDVSNSLVTEFMNRLRYPNKRIDRVSALVQNHMFPYFNSAKGARKFLNMLRGDVKMATDLLLLREADSSGKIGGQQEEYDVRALNKSRQLLQEVVDQGNAMTVKDLAIDGHDLMSLGIKPGQEIGKILNNLLDRVIDNPELNNKTDLLQLVPNG